MVVRLKLTLPQIEYSALLKLALSELRNPEGQLHWILRQELVRQHLLADKTHSELGMTPDKETSNV